MGRLVNTKEALAYGQNTRQPHFLCIDSSTAGNPLTGGNLSPSCSSPKLKACKCAVLQVAKGIEARRQHEDGNGNTQETSSFQPQLHAEDLLAALASHPRKALRCAEALENYRQMEGFKCAFPEDRYLSPPPTQTQSTVSPQGVKTAGASSASRGPSAERQPQEGQHAVSPQQPRTPPQCETARGTKRTTQQAAGAYSNPATQIMQTQQRDAGLETGLSFKPAVASALPLGI